ncbi:hypothetical protein HK098_005918 [Nowakowskiella sp. JEL0407]|nr:hypothetical protein HK098_005918 [Nowakowskiella sp. JEL0407]
MLSEEELAAAQALGSLKNNSNFLGRVKEFPVINNGFETLSSAYKAALATNSYLQYSANTVESLSYSVADRLNPILGPVDRFACSQLDLIERNFPSLTNYTQPPQEENSTNPPPKHPKQAEDDNSSNTVDMCAESPTSEGLNSESSSWSKVVSEVGTIVLTNDRIKGLKYCLQWLKYALNNINRQVVFLQQFLNSSGNNEINVQSRSTPPMSPQVSVLTRINREVVQTIRRVVNVIKRYAVIYLPFEARSNVRDFILSLPKRWALISSNYPTSPVNGVSSDSSSGTATPVETIDEARRILVFAETSKEMLLKVQEIFEDSVDVDLIMRSDDETVVDAE